jgi:hypothetical protein
MNNDREHKDNNSSHKDFEDKIRYVANSTGYEPSWAIAELLYRNHPTLNHKEFAICSTIADTLWDLE